MGATGTRNSRAFVRPRPTQRAAQAQERALRWAWALFVVFGIPFLLMAVLTTLAMAGIYVQAFEPFWQPFPPDTLKPFLGIATFAATLGYLAYRIGRARGFRTGHVAGMVAARNVAESRTPPAVQEPPAPEAAPVEIVVSPPAPR